MRNVFLLLAVGAMAACGGEVPRSDDPASQEPQAAAAETSSVAVPPVPPDLGEQPVGDQAPISSVQGDTSAQGIVRVQGATPLTQVVLRTGAGSAASRVGLVGELRDELANLSGLEVRVWGTVVPNQPGPPERAVQVTGYEIVSVNGVRPQVGALERRSDGIWLVGSDTVRLEAVPDGLAEQVGGRVWVVGNPGRGGLIVASYGVIVRP